MKEIDKTMIKNQKDRHSPTKGRNDETSTKKSLSIVNYKLLIKTPLSIVNYKLLIKTPLSIVNYKLLITLLIINCQLSILSAQDIEQLGVKKGIRANGSVTFNTVGYGARGIPERRENFNWFLSGNLNLQLFGYQTPFSFSMSNTQQQFTQPFNRFTFNPRYQWIQTYIGYNSMTFSPYTLSGVVFLGGGVQLTPGKWRIAAMYGRLQKEVLFDLADSTQHSQAAYRRMGYGVKVGTDIKNTSWDVSLFRAWDQENSLPFVLPESSLTPQENIAVSLRLRQTFLKKFFAEAEYGLSVLNRNQRAESEDSTEVSRPEGYNLLANWLPANSTQRYFDAFKGSLGYRGQGFGVQINYERVAPEYQTLGAYYFNNDLENITIAPQVQLFQNKLTLAANVGIQHNNLDGTLSSKTERFVGSLQAGYVPNAQWSVVGNYSNFATFTNLRPNNPDPFFRNDLDSLNFYQVNNTLQGTVTHAFGDGKTSSHHVSVTGSVQQTDDQASGTTENNISNFYTGNVNYTYGLLEKGMNVSLGWNYNQNEIPEAGSTFWGPSLSISQSFLQKKLRTSLSSTYNHSEGEAQEANDLVNVSWQLSYTLGGAARQNPKNTKTPPVKGNRSPGSGLRHSFSAGANWVNRLRDTEQQPKYQELTGTFRYTVSF